MTTVLDSLVVGLLSHVINSQPSDSVLKLRDPRSFLILVEQFCRMPLSLLDVLLESTTGVFGFQDVDGCCLSVYEITLLLQRVDNASKSALKVLPERQEYQMPG